MQETTNTELLQEAKSARNLLKWFGSGILGGICCGVLVAIGDHYELKALSAKIDNLENVIAPRVDRMWYEGGWESATRAATERQGRQASRAQIPGSKP